MQASGVHIPLPTFSKNSSRQSAALQLLLLLISAVIQLRTYCLWSRRSKSINRHVSTVQIIRLA